MTGFPKASHSYQESIIIMDSCLYLVCNDCLCVGKLIFSFHIRVTIGCYWCYHCCVFKLIEIPPKVSKSSAKEAVANIDDFVPDEEIDANFLTEEGDEHNKLFKKERLVILNFQYLCND